jgi:hypothetical protein
MAQTSCASDAEQPINTPVFEPRTELGFTPVMIINN